MIIEVTACDGCIHGRPRGSLENYEVLPEIGSPFYSSNGSVCSLCKGYESGSEGNAGVEQGNSDIQEGIIDIQGGDATYHGGSADNQERHVESQTSGADIQGLIRL